MVGADRKLRDWTADLVVRLSRCRARDRDAMQTPRTFRPGARRTDPSLCVAFVF